MEQKNFHFLTSYYPPYRGGIGFHTVNLARGLSSVGYEVFVWAAFDTSSRKTSRTSTEELSFVGGKHLGSSWTKERFEKVYEALLQYPGDIIVQYRPEAFPGLQSYVLMAFLKKISRHKHIKVHIIAHRLFEWSEAARWKVWSWVSPLFQLCVLQGLLRYSCCFYLTSSRLSLATKLCLGGKKVLHLPVSSYIYHKVQGVKIRNLRSAFCEQSKFILGTFSSFIEPEVLDILSQTLAILLKRHPKWKWLSFGRYSQGFVAFLQGKYPALSQRMENAGELDLKALSAHIQVCDVIFQPYYKGVSTRRTTAMAVLDHGVPLVTSRGVHTEAIWHNSGSVKLVKWSDVDGHVQAIEELASSAKLRQELSMQGRQTYTQHFSLERSVERIRSCSL